MSEEVPSRMYPMTWYNGGSDTIGPYCVFQLCADSVPDISNPPMDWPARLVGQLYDGSIGNEAFGCAIRSLRMLAINGPAAVLPGKYGSCAFGFDRSVWAKFRYDSTDSNLCFYGKPPGDDWTGVNLGPTETSNGEITSDGYGFVACSQPDVDKQRILVRQIEQPAWGFFVIPDDATAVYGNKDTGGVEKICSTCQLLEGDAVSDTGITYEIDFSRSQGISMPGQRFFAVSVGGSFYAVGAGQHTFNQCGSLSGGTSVRLGGTSSLGGGIVDCDPPLTGPIATGSTCTVQWCHNTKTFIINGNGCPLV